MTSGKYARKTPELPLDNPSFLEGRRRLNESVEANTDDYEFPARTYDESSFMETYESGKDALFYE